MVKEWTLASANSLAMRASLHACWSDSSSKVSGFVRLPLRQYWIVNLVLGRVVARLRCRRAHLPKRRLIGEGEVAALYVDRPMITRPFYGRR